MPPKSLKWSWQDDDGKFRSFEASFQTAVEKLYVLVNGTGVHIYDHAKDWKYEFNFDAMTQKNRDSGKVRKIQREGGKALEASSTAAAVPADAPPSYQWMWLNDKKKWIPFGHPHDKILEDKMITFQKGEAGPMISMTIAENTYIIDVLKKVQTNQKTTGKRTIKRVPDVDLTVKKSASSHDDDDEDAPAKKSHKPELPSVAVAGSKKGMSGGHAGGPTKVIKKGKGVVDTHSGLADKAHIYESGKKVYQCMLNQTNIGTNNNKFYVIQLLELDEGTGWYVFTRWGRVGATGQQSLDHFMALPGATAQFCKKFRDKTSNDFNNLEHFSKVPGKYQLMDIDLGNDDATTGGGDDDAVEDGSVPTSKLSKPLQDLMKLISNKEAMTKSMKELEIDTNKMPLGKISKKQIKDAFGFLKQIESELKNTKPNNSKLVDASSMFYTLIPHDFGMMMPPVIRSDDHLKRKMDLLDILSDLEIASKLLSESKKIGANPLDQAYGSLKCDISALDHSDAVFKRVEQYVKNTHGKTHTSYRLAVEDVYVVNRDVEQERYKAFQSLPNKQMLWHGSRATNFMGILSQGLRIAPPEAPVTGYMFGKGVYFADCSSKSGNYCHTNSTNNTGLLLLCEVALGSMHDCTSAKYMDKPMAGSNSTRGVGKMAPAPSGDVVDENGVKWPVGKMEDSGVSHTALLYPEYIVYNTAQCRMSYLVKLKFQYGKK